MCGTVVLFQHDVSFPHEAPSCEVSKSSTKDFSGCRRRFIPLISSKFFSNRSFLNIYFKILISNYLIEFTSRFVPLHQVALKKGKRSDRLGGRVRKNPWWPLARHFLSFLSHSYSLLVRLSRAAVVTCLCSDELVLFGHEPC